VLTSNSNAFDSKKELAAPLCSKKKVMETAFNWEMAIWDGDWALRDSKVGYLGKLGHPGRILIITRFSQESKG